MKQTAKYTPDVMTFAQGELSHFLPAHANTVELKADNKMEPGSFAGVLNADGITLRGADESCILHAIYTFLEQMGWRFEITGPVKLFEGNIAEFKPFLITPVIKQRGIRQHINFPMDISSYTLNEAIEYIRNLARLRYNHITFHSYPNQWIDGEQASDIKNAGGFFYGQTYEIPDIPLFKENISNKKIYCIPDIEPFLDNEEKKSEMAISWLQTVMLEAKRCGMHIQFSFEPRSSGTELIQLTCRHILELYPMIDSLELISCETGGWGEPNDEATVRKNLSVHYSDELQDSPEFRTAIKSGKANFDDIMVQLGNMLTAIQAFRPEAQKEQIALALGIYCVLPEFHAAILRVIRERLPLDITFALLPEHSSRRVADALCQGNEDPNWKRTLLYSWLEFDGTMYLQQNGIPGIEGLLSNFQDKIQGIAFNHWRTAENQLVARYAAETCVYGSRPAAEFYKSYATQLGIGNPEEFARAYGIIGDADWIATNKLFNIGFCFASCWRKKGFGYFENWRIEEILETHDMFELTHNLLNSCSGQTSSPVARNFLSFLDNRICCSMIYLKAMAKGSELQQFKGLLPEQVTEEQKLQITNICDAAIALLEQYMTLHAKSMPDRGCEGTLISVYHTPPAVLKRIREEYTGIPSDQPCNTTGHDEPPSPIEW